MAMESSWRAGKSIQDWINLFCGALLFISPWALGFAGDMMAARTAWVGGVLIGVMAILALVQFSEWEDWIALIVGVAVVIAPWVLGFSMAHAATAACVVLGGVVVLASISELWVVRNPPVTAK